MVTRNGICKKQNEDKSRVHQFTPKVDAYGNAYESCDKCGTMITDEVYEE